MFRTASILGLAVLLIGSRAACEAGESLADALAAHKAAVDAIDTIYLRFEINTELNDPNLSGFVTPGTVVGEYWRDHDFERISYSKPGAKEAVYRTPQTVTVVGDGIDPKTKSPLSTASIVPSGSPVFLAVAPWRHALFALDSQRGTGTDTLAEQVKAIFGNATYKLIDGQ